MEHCEKNYILHGHQWRCDVAGKVAILLKPGEGYEWHFDNLDFAERRLTTSPCFMVHRIQPVVDNRRWAFVDFVNTPNYLDKTKKDLTRIFNRYFDEDTRRKLLPS